MHITPAVQKGVAKLEVNKLLIGSSSSGLGGMFLDAIFGDGSSIE